RHRRPVHRRTGHAADHAYVPHRWRGFACGPGQRGGNQVQRYRGLRQHDALRHQLEGRTRGHLAFRRTGDLRRQRPRTRTPQDPVRRDRAGGRWRSREGWRASGDVGSADPSDRVGIRRRRPLREHRRRRDRCQAGGRSHRPVDARRHHAEDPWRQDRHASADQAGQRERRRCQDRRHRPLGEHLVPGGRADHGIAKDPRHYRWSAARGRSVRSAQAEGSGSAGRAFGHHQLRQGHQGQAAPDHQGHRWFGTRRADSEVPPAEPAGHPAPAGCRAAGCLPGQGNPGRVPPAGREDQRQAHRGDHPPDAAQGRDHRSGQQQVPERRTGRTPARYRGECTPRCPQRADRPLRSGAAGYHQGLAGDRVVHLGGLLPGDHPRADRSCRPRHQGQPARPEGKRDRRPPDPGRY
uniref:Phosphate acetyltransferase n=1 Tax=Parastrongyloides trichosuri TaxID=131310 RepID=A0A0N4Z2X9_PARTI